MMETTYILTAEIDKDNFAWLDDLRRPPFPAGTEFPAGASDFVSSVVLGTGGAAAIARTATRRHPALFRPRDFSRLRRRASRPVDRDRPIAPPNTGRNRG